MQIPTEFVDLVDRDGVTFKVALCPTQGEGWGWTGRPWNLPPKRHWWGYYTSKCHNCTEINKSRLARKVSNVLQNSAEIPEEFLKVSEEEVTEATFGLLRMLESFK